LRGTEPKEGHPVEAVGLTAQWTAAARARETARPDRLFDDPWADSLAGPEGSELLALMEQKLGAVPTIPVRTRFFDDTIVRLTREPGFGQVVLLAAGMDTRAFRLELPSSVRLFELDQPALLTRKDRRLAEMAATPRCARSPVGVDLSGDWGDDLVRAGFRDEPTVWVAEGLLSYLTEAQVHGLLDAVTALSTPRDRLLIDVAGRSLLDSAHLVAWLRILAERNMGWHFGTDDPEGLLARHGWDAEVIQYGEERANFGRWPWPPAPRDDLRWPHSYLVIGRRRPASGLGPGQRK
jgi:methyltransferase (TIGR00027 family)